MGDIQNAEVVLGGSIDNDLDFVIVGKIKIIIQMTLIILME
jgi:hypothetical protein